MNKDNIFKSSPFFMEENDILHILLEEDGGIVDSIVLGGEESVDEVPAKVIALDATDLISGGFTANWQFTENADGYYFSLATDPDMTPHVAGYDNLDVGNVNSIDLTGLTSGKTYYYQISAYNEVGTGEASDIISIALAEITITDVDGNIYHTVVIGDQEWLVENLRTIHYADGTPIPHISSYSDWFMPSKDELNAMYVELYLYGVGGFTTDGTYWSSTEAAGMAGYHGCYQYFFDGTQSTAGKGSKYNVRACRAFTSVSPSYSLRDIGPAGGFIFYKSGNNYLEAAPVDQAIIPAGQEWSNIQDVEIGVTAQGTAIGTGQANTNAIIGQIGHVDSGAKLCDDLSSDDLWAADTAGAYCWYANDISNKTAYGALYNWYATTNIHGLAPTGWRVPTIDDYTTLQTYLGGHLVAGGKLKETGYTHWLPPNTDAVNSVGFYGRGGGYRSDIFDHLLMDGFFWSTDSFLPIPANAYIFPLTYNNGLTSVDTVTAKYIGCSVRCMRDVTTGTSYVTYTDAGTTFRKGVRSHAFVIDVALTALGFSGVEDTDWKNLKTVDK